MAMVPISSNYCGYCGNRLQAIKSGTRACAKCGNRIPDMAKYCPYCGEAIADQKEEKRRMRFSWLKAVERKYSSDHTCFRTVGAPEAEDEKEAPVFDKAGKRAKDANKPIMIHVILFENRGEIDSFPWALIKPDGTVEYIYS